MNTEEYACMRAVEDTHWWYRGLHALVSRAVGRHLSSGAPVVDVGCGTGGMAARLESAYVITGVDLAPEAVAFCRERGMTRVAQADAGQLPLAGEVAEGVLLLDVLYHAGVPDRAAVLREAYRIVRPGGIVVLNVPAYQWLYSSHDVAVHTAHRFTRGEINGLLREVGFEIVQSSYWNSLLLPAIVACRVGRKWLPERGSDLDPHTPDWVNRVLGGLLAFERQVMACCAWPAGLSILVVARRPSQ